jgi:hypothetical protein
LVALDRASTHTQALAGIAVQDDGGVFGDGRMNGSDHSIQFLSARIRKKAHGSAVHGSARRGGPPGVHGYARILAENFVMYQLVAGFGFSHPQTTRSLRLGWKSVTWAELNT